MKIFTTKQIAGIDRYTIENEPVADIDLMERASLQVTGWIIEKFQAGQKFVFFVGPGNNGGDALAVARQLAEKGYSCEVFLPGFGKGFKGSPAINLSRLENQAKVKVQEIAAIGQFPAPAPGDIIVDGLFGSGLTRPLEGFPAEIVRQINRLPNLKIAIDIPSGLMGEDNSANIPENILQADFTLTFQFPKISFFFPENEKFTGQWDVLPIGLHVLGIEKTPSDFYFLGLETVKSFFPKRPKFSHKGTFGHALLIAGSFGKMGAAVLASEACLRSGAGLLTAHVPRLGYNVIQTAVPEAMADVDRHDAFFTEFPALENYSAVAVGPGLGKKTNTQRALLRLLDESQKPLVIDADALNIISENQSWIEKLPENSILTPHPGEFKRLAGESENSYRRLLRQCEFASQFKVIVVLKGAYTSIALPDGRLFFNSTGNPGMATAGSGDSLTGMILGFLAQGLEPWQSALAGVYLHGLAGDLAAAKKSEKALTAGDIISSFGDVFLKTGI